MTDTSRPRRLRVALVALAVLLGGAALLPLVIDGDEDGQVPLSPAASAPPAPGAPAPAPSEVPVPLTAASSEVTWELFQGVALPTSRTDGPTRVDGPVHAGFTQTPTGALVAAAQIAGRSIIEPSLTGLRQIGRAQLVPGPGQTAYLNLVDGFKDNQAPAAGYAQYVGFRYITYTPDLAVISLATRGSTGRVQVGTNSVRWLEGDWKLELPPSGLQQPQVVQDLAGYVPWSGVS